MEIDKHLVEYLSAIDTTNHSGTVFRATRPNADPLEPSAYGGRWCPRPKREPGFRVLYTSLDGDGAISEVATPLFEQDPPILISLAVAEIAVTTSRTLRLVETDLQQLGVDKNRYGEREYTHTQRIGAALNYLEIDGLISPSARWPCDNLTLFFNNHSLDERLEIVRTITVDTKDWMQQHG